MRAETNLFRLCRRVDDRQGIMQPRIAVRQLGVKY